MYRYPASVSPLRCACVSTSGACRGVRLHRYPARGSPLSCPGSLSRAVSRQGSPARVRQYPHPVRGSPRLCSGSLSRAVSRQGSATRVRPHPHPVPATCASLSVSGARQSASLSRILIPRCQPAGPAVRSLLCASRPAPLRRSSCRGSSACGI